MKIIPISLLRTDFERVVRRVGRSRAPVVITFRGKPIARVRITSGRALTRSLAKPTPSGKAAKRISPKR